MPLPIILSNSFKGVKRLHYDTSEATHIEFVTLDVVDEWVRLILSDAAYIDISSSTAKAKWTDLFNGVVWNNGSIAKIHKGFTEVLRCISFFEIVKNPISHSANGFKISKSANSDQPSVALISAKASDVYNGGIIELRTNIYDFLYFFRSITANITGFTDNGSGSYTIEADSVKYLDDGDSVTINGIDYIVSNLNYSLLTFNITAGLGLSFSGSFSYEPFKDFNCPELNIIVW